eukprot:scaffold19428_cov101-Isochrysis_galbana.AAC.2
MGEVERASKRGSPVTSRRRSTHVDWLPVGEWEFGCGASAHFWCRVSLINVSLNVKCPRGPLDILHVTLHTTTPRTTATTTTTDRHNDTQHSAVRTTHNRWPNSQLQRKE